MTTEELSVRSSIHPEWPSAVLGRRASVSGADDFMVIRRTAARFDRRRRALVEDSCSLAAHQPDSSCTLSEGGTKPCRRYPEGTFDDQPRLTDLIPVRRWAVSVWILLSLTFVAALISADLVSRAYLQGARVDSSVLKLNSHRSLSDGATTLVLLSGAFYASLILMLRRHRLDDYRGRYRVWYSIVAALLLIMMGLTTGLGSLVWNLSISVASTHTSLDTARWIPAFAWGFGVVAAIRLLAEIRESRASVAAMAMTGLLGMAAHLATTNWVAIAPTALVEPTVHGCFIAAQFVGLLTLVLYARHVAMDSQGLLRQVDSEGEEANEPRRRSSRLSRLFRRASRDESSSAEEESADDSSGARTSARRKKRRVKAAETGAERQEREDDAATNDDRSSQARPPKQKQSPAASARDDSPADSGDDEDEDDTTVPMSRAERKRLRREKRKQRKAA